MTKREENTPITVTQLPDFWDHVLKAKIRFLGLGYDGTLAPFAIDPMQARPLDGVVELLRPLSDDCHTHRAIISGRSVSEVMMLPDNPPVTVVGSHGYECTGGTRGCSTERHLGCLYW
jgi:trehalose-phosphatase